MRFLHVALILIFLSTSALAAEQENSMPEKYSLLTARNIFSSARQDIPDEKTEEKEPEPKPEIQVEDKWVLRGCLIYDQTGKAIFENSSSGEYMSLTQGEIIDGQTIEKITVNDVALVKDDTKTLIAVGFDLDGQPSASAAIAPATLTKKDENPATPTTNSKADSILERLKRRRQNQTQ